MAVAQKMTQFMTRASWIRKMFEEGARLKAIHGAENVFDFSLGNPNVAPPQSLQARLEALVRTPPQGLHAYMPNAGLPRVRQALADYLTREHQVPFQLNHVVLTCGAAGALNVVMKALLDPGDEVLVPTPHFVEYGFYADNHGGLLRTARTREDFQLDLDAIGANIGLKTKIVLINSPNNPTGQIYDPASLDKLGEILAAGSERVGHAIYLVADEPYRKIVYDGATVPSLFNCYRNSIVVTSYSKDLSIPGERIGYAAVHPDADDGSQLLDAMTLANRILGFVNAPALMQWLIKDLLDECIDTEIYKRKRDRLVDALRAAGYQCGSPPGAFYLFPRAPIEDDVSFVRLLQEEKILVVPGSGFGGPGHFRIAYCVDDATIEGALPGFRRAMGKVRT